MGVPAQAVATSWGGASVQSAGGELVAHSLLEGPEEALATIDPVCLEIGGGRHARPPPHYPCAVLTQGLSLFQQMLFLSFVALKCRRHFPYIE